MSTITIGNATANAYAQTGDNSGDLTITVVGGVINCASMNGAVAVPSGTTAQRPATATNGMIRYNSNTATIEVLASGSWTSLI